MRIKQFYRAITMRDEGEGIEFASEILNFSEMEVFIKLSPSERFHAVNVSNETGLQTEKEFKNISGEELKAVKKAALLHDIGKTAVPLNLMEKVMAVMLSKTVKKMPYTGNLRILKSYFGHPSEGLIILRSFSSFDDFPWLYDLVLLHHEKRRFLDKYKDMEREKIIFNIYKKADDSN